jgi:hypothetical protein
LVHTGFLNKFVASLEKPGEAWQIKSR